MKKVTFEELKELSGWRGDMWGRFVKRNPRSIALAYYREDNPSLALRDRFQIMVPVGPGYLIASVRALPDEMFDPKDEWRARPAKLELVCESL